VTGVGPQPLQPHYPGRQDFELRARKLPQLPQIYEISLKTQTKACRKHVARYFAPWSRYFAHGHRPVKPQSRLRTGLSIGIPARPDQRHCWFSALQWHFRLAVVQKNQPKKESRLGMYLRLNISHVGFESAQFPRGGIVMSGSRQPAGFACSVLCAIANPPQVVVRADTGSATDQDVSSHQPSGEASELPPPLRRALERISSLAVPWNCRAACPLRSATAERVVRPVRRAGKPGQQTTGAVT
jgi:hypothetical protein